MPPVGRNEQIGSTEASSEFTVRPARPEDCEEIHRLITQLAVYEKMEDQVKITPDILREDAFGTGHPPRFFALMVEKQGTPGAVGYCLFNDRYSTWVGKTLWIEDLYVIEECRRMGIGKAIFQHLSQRAEAEGYARIEWCVLGWNTSAIDFYKKIGGVDMTLNEEWHVFRLARNDFLKLI